MLECIRKIRRSYPGITSTIEKLQVRLTNVMEDLKIQLDTIPDREKDILTLVVIHEVHKIVDEVFQDILKPS
jgi:hypothetical protein